MESTERAYYFGVFTVIDSDQQKHIEVAAFRHIKDKVTGKYHWFIHNPRYKRAIDVDGVPKKYRAWCRKVTEADVYLLEREKKQSNSSIKKGKAKKSDHMVTRWLHILQDSQVTQDTTADAVSVVASPKYF